MMQVDFAIIMIRRDEYRAILERFPGRAYRAASGRIYGIADIKTKPGKNCTVVPVRYSGQNTEAAQQFLKELMADLNPQMLLIVGIASGVPSDDFTLGDVIVSSRIDDINVSKRYEDGVERFDISGGSRPSINNIAASLPVYDADFTNWNTSESITVDRPKVDLKNVEVEIQEKLVDEQTNASWYEKALASLGEHFGDEKNRTRPPLFKTGAIAFGNSLIRNTHVLVQWLQNTDGILAVEMEMAGMYQATQNVRQKYPVMAIRGISDIIGLDRDNQWTKYACQTAAAFAYAFVKTEIVPPRVTTTGTLASDSLLTAQHKDLPPQTPSSTQANSTKPINVFISYSENDERFKRQLEAHLSLLRRENVIRTWDSQQVKLGKNEREEEVADHINSSQIILLLMSPSFISSDQIYNKEMMRAIERQKTGDPVRVIPIAVRRIASTDPDKTPFQKLQGLPRSGTPIESWRSADEAWALIAQEIRELCKSWSDTP